MNGERVLVTGGTGLLGNHLIRILLERGYKVTALVRHSSDISHLKNLNCEIIRLDMQDFEEVESGFAGCNYVIHSAALTSQDEPDLQVYLKANVDTTKNLVKAGKKLKIKKFILVSSGSCFTGGSLRKPGDERMGFNEKLKDSGYAYSKYLAQEFVLKEAREKGFPALVVAPTFMIGPLDYKPSSGKLILYILKNKLLFYSPGGKSFVDVRAVAVATVNALHIGKVGESYLLSGVNMTYRNFYEKTAAVVAQKKHLIPVPAFTGKFMRLLSILFPFQKLKLWNTNLYNILMDNYFSNKKAKEELQMPETHLEHLLEETVKWLRENHISS